MVIRRKKQVINEITGSIGRLAKAQRKESSKPKGTRGSGLPGRDGEARITPTIGAGALCARAVENGGDDGQDCLASGLQVVLIVDAQRLRDRYHLQLQFSVAFKAGGNLMAVGRMWQLIHG